MAISRSKDKLAYGYHVDFAVPWAYASSGGTISTFVADDSDSRNTVGATYRVHKFSSVGGSQIFFDTAGLVDVLIIAGGGGGGNCGQSNQGGGGGAGGVILKYEQYVNAGSSLVYVGAGGPSITNGDDSYFNQFVAYGGGAGASNWGSVGNAGGSGGGTSFFYFQQNGMVDQGNLGGHSPSNGVAGGGGGAGKPANYVYNISNDPPNGGDGIQVAFESNTLTYYAGGGVGGVRGSYTTAVPAGGLGGGGNLGGARGSSWNGGDATFYGSGGGGAARTATSGSNVGGYGYQGLVIIRYKV